MHKCKIKDSYGNLPFSGNASQRTSSIIKPQRHVPASHISSPFQKPQPQVVKQKTKAPYSHKNHRLYGGKNGTAHDNEPADHSEYNRYEDQRFDRSRQLWFSEAQNYCAKDCEEEECILSETIKGKQDTHVS
jgi:hypothetical protein